MKKYTKIYLPGLLLLSIFAVVQHGCSSSYYEQSNAGSNNPGVYNIQELNNYGEWILVDGYGRAWYPFAVEGWRPFDNGHWSWLNDEWTWVSYEPFGWIVYHYGYWYDDPLYGWVWIPSDNIWSPANVMWITYDDYVGWAPLPPPGIKYRNPWEEGEHHHWRIVRLDNFTREDIHNYEISSPPARNNELSVERQNDRMPPSKSTIERSIGRSLPEVKIKHEIVKLPPREIQKMNLPQDENKRVEKNSQRVRNEVLVPREEFHKQQSVKSNRKR